MSERSTRQVAIPTNYSRSKALKLLSEESDISNSVCEAVPSNEVLGMFMLLHRKIGADSEIASDKDQNALYLSDYWRVLYLKNNLIPGDIPFTIIFRAFMDDLVLGKAERKGNNQASICQAFNEWIVKDQVKWKLYQQRDIQHPEGKKKQIAYTAKKKDYGRPSHLNNDMSKEEIENSLLKYRKVKGIAEGIEGLGSFAIKLSDTLDWINNNE